MPSAVLFDLGNVMVRWDPRNFYTPYFGDAAKADAFVRDVVNMAWHGEHDRGVSMDDNALPLIARHPEHAAAIRAFKSGWPDMFDGYVPGVGEIFDALEARGVPLYALTNLPGEKWTETADLFPRLHRFRDVIVSGHEKLIKPDPAIFALTLSRLGLPASEVFFTDDVPANIAAAEEIGFATHHFTGAEGLIAALRAHGLLDA
jgi:2-haloacid dehalogenase